MCKELSERGKLWPCFSFKNESVDGRCYCNVFYIALNTSNKKKKEWSFICSHLNELWYNKVIIKLILSNINPMDLFGQGSTSVRLEFNLRAGVARLSKNLNTLRYQ